VNTDAVPYCELDVVTVQHRHQSLFQIAVRAKGGAFAENCLSVFAADGQFRLEDVVFVLWA
jgi:hypothetical protein